MCRRLEQDAQPAPCVLAGPELLAELGSFGNPGVAAGNGASMLAFCCIGHIQSVVRCLLQISLAIWFLVFHPFRNSLALMSWRGQNVRQCRGRTGLV